MSLSFLIVLTFIILGLLLVYNLSGKYPYGSVSHVETTSNNVEQTVVKKTRFIPCSEEMYLQESYFIEDANSYDSVKRKERIY